MSFIQRCFSQFLTSLAVLPKVIFEIERLNGTILSMKVLNVNGDALIKEN
jgi:hypothetical protein